MGRLRIVVGEEGEGFLIKFSTHNLRLISDVVEYACRICDLPSKNYDLFEEGFKLPPKESSELINKETIYQLLPCNHRSAKIALDTNKFNGNTKCSPIEQSELPCEESFEELEPPKTKRTKERIIPCNPIDKYKEAKKIKPLSSSEDELPRISTYPSLNKKKETTKSINSLKECQNVFEKNAKKNTSILNTQPIEDNIEDDEKLHTEKEHQHKVIPLIKTFDNKKKQTLINESIKETLIKNDKKIDEKYKNFEKQKNLILEKIERKSKRENIKMISDESDESDLSDESIKDIEREEKEKEDKQQRLKPENNFVISQSKELITEKDKKLVTINDNKQKMNEKYKEERKLPQSIRKKLEEEKIKSFNNSRFEKNKKAGFAELEEIRETKWIAVSEEMKIDGSLSAGKTIRFKVVELDEEKFVPVLSAWITAEISTAPCNGILSLINIKAKEFIHEANYRLDSLNNLEIKVLAVPSELQLKNTKDVLGRKQERKETEANANKKDENAKESLEAFICGQVHYYFGDKNYSKDLYMQMHANRSPDKFLPVNFLLNFPKIKKFIRQETQLWNYLLEDPYLATRSYELDQDKKTIRRKGENCVSLLPSEINTENDLITNWVQSGNNPIKTKEMEIKEKQKEEND